MYLIGWSIREDLLKTAGFDHTPTTLLDFFTMQKEWDEEKGSEHDFAFAASAYEGYNLRLYPYVEMAVSEYITQYETPDQPLSFDTPTFRQVLNAIEALDYQPENVDEAIAAVTDDRWLFECPEAIFNINDNNPLNVGESAAYNKTLIPPLPFEENGVKRVTGLMYLAIVNPYSQHVENAIAFLTYAAEHSATDTTLTLYPDENAPVPDQGVLQSLQEAQQELEKQQRLLEKADEEHQAEIKAVLVQLKAAITDLKQRQYLVSTDAIQAYRALEPYLYIPRDSPYRRAGKDIKMQIESIMKRYAASHMDGEELIRELNQKFELLFLEK